jgi:multicomponent Na+:H+ antiporter subunit D
MINLVAAPVLIPLFTAVVLLALNGRPAVQRTVSIVSHLFLVAAAIALLVPTLQGEVLVLTLGNWAPSVGIAWVADGLSAVMVFFALLTSLAVTIYSEGTFDAGDGVRKYFHPLHHFILTGVCGSFLTGDFFNLFVFFEIMLLASFALIALGVGPRQLNLTFPYVLVNLIASAILLAGIGAVYGTAGTVNMAEVSLAIQAGELPAAFWAGVGMILLVFAVKAALLPLFFWLPDAYPISPIAVNALFASLLSKVGVYTLFRTVPLVTGGEFGVIQSVLIAVGAGTMLIGVLGALGRSGIRDILSFHIVSQVGYMVFGLAVFTPLAVAAGLFYTVHNIIVKTGLIMAGGMAERMGGSQKLGVIKGVARSHPWVAVAFFICAVALAGLPPFSGFWGKFFLAVAGYQAGMYAATTVAIIVGLFTLSSMLKIWLSVFWGEPEGNQAPAFGSSKGMLVPTLFLAAIAVAMGMLGGPIMHYSLVVAENLLAVTPYVEGVMQAGGLSVDDLAARVGGGP